jgi:Transposase DDE domain group 1
MFRFPGVQFSERQTGCPERKHPAMSDSQPVMHFPLLGPKPVQVDFTGGSLSSDGGLLLLAQLDQQLGLTKRVAACLKDPRLPERIRHSLLDLIRQRVYQIAAGYEDANDATALRSDPALKVAVGRCPQSDPDLASQPTLSRLESTVTEAECHAINTVLLDQFLKTPRPKPREIVLDFDPTVDPTHGQQEFAFFNGHYGTYCYLPLFVFARVSGERDQFLVSAELPESHGKETEAVLSTLQRLVEGIRQRWPGMRVIFRGDAWFATPAIYEWCEAHAVPYAIAIAGNPALHTLSQRWREQAAAAAPNAPTGRARRFGTVEYRAGEWTQHRLVVVKAEQTPLGPNPRYVVVWGLAGKPRQQYQFYAGRGACENRIKELKDGVKSDRTSCCEFASNKVRLMLASVAYVLLQQLRRVARQTGLSRAQVEGLRQAVIKIAARVTERVRRVVIELCSSCPSQGVWRVLARRLGIVCR